MGNALTPIDPRTGRPGRPVPVDDPYNLYFTPNGRYAIVVAERLHRLDFRSAHTLKLVHSLTVPCAGVNHLDFSPTGRYAIASCEFSGRLLKVDVRHFRVLAVRSLPRRFAVPQDVRSSPDAKIFYVADLAAGGVWEVDPARFKIVGFIHTGAARSAGEGRSRLDAPQPRAPLAVSRYGARRIRGPAPRSDEAARADDQMDFAARVP